MVYIINMPLTNIVSYVLLAGRSIKSRISQYDNGVAVLELVQDY